MKQIFIIETKKGLTLEEVHSCLTEKFGKDQEIQIWEELMVAELKEKPSIGDKQ